MKKVITILVALVVSANSFVHAQNLPWALSAGGTGFDVGYSVTTDANGNVYVTGSFTSPTITFGTTTLTNAGSTNIYIVKYDATGTVLWAKREGGNYDDGGYSVTTDANGNVYVTGSFSSPTITFGTTTLTNANNGGYASNIFIAKYDSAGTVLWAKSAGSSAGNYDDVGYSVTTDASGNVYVSGCFSSPIITFGTTTLTTAGGFGIFIAKYDAAGTVLWAKSASGALGQARRNSVSTDASGNVYVTGFFQSPTITFGTTTLTNTDNFYSSDIFIAKYDAAGNVLWANSEGGTSSVPGNAYDESYSVTTDANGNVYVTGYYNSSTITFGTTTLTNTNNGASIFIAKYDAAGTVLWAKSADGISDWYGPSVATDASGNVYVTGHFKSPTITFGTTTLTNADNTGNTFDIFIAIYDSTGTLLWAKSAGGTGNDYCYSVTTYGIGNVYITGTFQSPTLTLGSNTLTNAGGSGLYDIFIANYFGISLYATRYEFYQNVTPPLNNPYNTIMEGKTVRLKVKVKNEVGQNLLTLKGYLRTSSPYIIITDSTSSYNNINYNSSAWGFDEFEIIIAANTPAGYVADFTIVMKDQIVTNTVWKSSITIPVTSAFTSLIQVIDDDNNPDSNGNGNGIIEPYEIIEIIPLLDNINNLSNENIYSVSGKLVALDSGISVWNNYQGVNTIVMDNYRYNFTNNVWGYISPNQTSITPEADYVFYNSYDSIYNLNFEHIVCGYPNQEKGSSWDTLGIRYCWAAPFILNPTAPNPPPNSTVGLKNIFSINTFTISPNPTSSTITLTIPKLTNTNVTITNLTGMQVATYNLQNTSTKTIDVSHLAEGVYFVNLKSDEGALTKKLVKTN